jgi:anti-sigma regulatory factor (Ser/Thr protein kinase)
MELVKPTDDATASGPCPPGGKPSTPLSLDAPPGRPTSEHLLVELPHLPRAVPEARLAIRRLLASRDLPGETVGVAELLVSELVTNAVKYGAPPVWLLLELRPGLVHASVSDTSTALPRRRPTTPMSEGGRGLLVLDALAGSWGAAAVDSGKYLWFDLPVPVAEPA